MHREKRKFIIPAAVSILLVLIGIISLFLYYCYSKTIFSGNNPQSDDGRMADDLMRLSEENYEAVFLSMHSPEEFREENFSSFCGVNTLVTSHVVLNAKEISEYLECILNSGNTITHLYLCLDPELLWTTVRQNPEEWSAGLKNNLYAYMEAHPDISFEILLPYPYIEYWLELKDDKLDMLITLYHTLINELAAYSNVTVFFPGVEYWLMVNPDNYAGTLFDANEIITQKIFLYTFCDSVYQISPENEDQFWNSLREIIAREKSTPTLYPDLSDWCLVFFGDSVLGNFPGSFSIPGYITGLSKAVTCNFAVGGSSGASHGEDTQDFPNIIDDFLKNNTSPSESGLIFTPEGAGPDSLQEKKLCFIINYGFNDYFSGSLIENPQDPYDVTSYKGGMRTCISRLQSAFPDAYFILVTPTHTGYFNDGMEINSEQGDIFPAYIDAAGELAEELQIFFIDNYNNFVITQENLEEYLSDLCHPNERGRLLIATELMYYIHEHLAQ